MGSRQRQPIHRVVVLGGGYAGVLAATRLARSVPPELASVALVNATEDFVERIRLHQSAGLLPAARRIVDLLGTSGAELIVGWAERLDLEARQVFVRTCSEVRSLPFDTLLYALGSSTDLAGVPGAADHCLPVESPEWAQRVAALPSGAEVAVVGGGLTGIEVATEIAEAFPALRVRLVTRGVPGAGLSQPAQRYLARTFESLGVAAEPGVSVSGVQDRALVLGSGRRIAFDLALWSAGFRVSPLAREAGLAVDDRGRVQVGALLQSSSHPCVYAAGDAAGAPSAWGEALRMGCVTAMPTGAAAADNIAARIAGNPETPFRFAFAIQCLSLGRRRGLVQMVRSNDQPLEVILSGAAGATLKEQIVRYTLRSLELSGSGRFRYRWPKRGWPPSPGAAKALPA